MKTMKWIRSTGTELETNTLPDTVAYCRSLGWMTPAEKKEADAAEAKRLKEEEEKAKAEGKAE